MKTNLDTEHAANTIELELYNKINEYYEKQKTINQKTKELTEKIDNERVQEIINTLVDLDETEITSEIWKILTECGFLKHKVQMAKYKVMWKKATERSKSRMNRIKSLNELAEVLSNAGKTV